MTKILFICHGNICRSPMAEFIMKKLVRERKLEYKYEIASAATSREELGNPVYPPARRKLAEHGINCSGKTARQITCADCEKYDYLICMESYNIRNAIRVCGEENAKKFTRLMDYTSRPGDVADPWYSGDFETAYRDIMEGCEGLLEKLEK